MSSPSPVPKKKGAPVQRTPAQIAALERAARVKREADDLAEQKTKADAVAARTAQIANLLISGHTFESIGAQIGMTATELEREFNKDSARYVRTQASLRIWVRNYLSSQYAAMLAVDMPRATDAQRPDMLEHQDRAMRLLKEMGRLHGAEAPTQSEVKVEAAPESIERMVRKLAEQQGAGYDMDVFDLDDDDVTEVGEQAQAAPADALRALEAASREVERPQEGDNDDGL